MATILLLLAVVIISAAYLLATGLLGLEDSVGPWDTAAAGHPSQRRQHRSVQKQAPAPRFEERRYHDEDYPFHRRRTDDVGGES